jgi:hypothetical protein
VEEEEGEIGLLEVLADPEGTEERARQLMEERERARRRTLWKSTNDGAVLHRMVEKQIARTYVCMCVCVCFSIAFTHTGRHAQSQRTRTCSHVHGHGHPAVTHLGTHSLLCSPPLGHTEQQKENAEYRAKLVEEEREASSWVSFRQNVLLFGVVFAWCVRV